MPKLVSKSLDGNVTVTELSEQEHDQYLRNRATAVLIPSPDYGEVVPVNKLRDLILGWTLIIRVTPNLVAAIGRTMIRAMSRTLLAQQTLF